MAHIYSLELPQKLIYGKSVIVLFCLRIIWVTENLIVFTSVVDPSLTPQPPPKSKKQH